jgi:hypothetical protein
LFSLDLVVRELTKHEQAIVRLCHKKYGASDRDKLFFLDDGEAMLQVWGTDGDGPWVHLTNLGSWLADGSMTEQEISEGQI